MRKRVIYLALELDRSWTENYFGLHKHVELTADGCRTVSRQPIEIVHHVHLIVISQSMGDLGPPRFGRCRLASERRLEPDDSGVQLGWDSDLVAKAPLELTGPQPRVVCKIGHSNASAAGEQSPCGGGKARGWNHTRYRVEPR